MSNTNRAFRVYELPPSFRFPPLREGNREGRAYSVPPASRGNLKGGSSTAVFCELWLGDWYNTLCLAYARYTGNEPMVGISAYGWNGAWGYRYEANTGGLQKVGFGRGYCV